MTTCRCTPDSPLCTHCNDREQAAESRREDIDDRMGDRYADRMAGF